MRVHPAADSFPMLEGDAFQELKSSIANHGQMMPCVVWSRKGQEDILLDGRNRYQACEELNILPNLEPYHGGETDALNLIVALNLKRRMLTSVQKAAIAAELVPMYEAATLATRASQITENLKKARQSPLPRIAEEVEKPSTTVRLAREAVSQAAAAMGVSRNSVSEARALQKENVEAFEAVKKGETPSIAEARGKKRKPLTPYDRAAKAVFKLDDNEWLQLRKERDDEIRR